VWVCVCVGGCFDKCVGVSVIRVLVFTVFCIVCTAFLYCFVYVHLFLFVLSVPV
jgi:Na+/H+ antiporter NhaC